MSLTKRTWTTPLLGSHTLTFTGSVTGASTKLTIVFQASGAIYGIVGALIAWMIMTRQWRSIRCFSRLAIALLLLFYTSTMEADIDYMAHLGGFLAGLLFAGIYIMISWKRRKPLRNERKA